MNNCKLRFQTRWSLLYIPLLSMALLAVGNLNLNCLSNCYCNVAMRTSLTIDCQGRSDINPEQLSEQLDSLLSSNLTYCHDDCLTSLSIVNTPLTHVPRSICRLTTLTRLHLDANQLTRLPDDCFPHLKHLIKYRSCKTGCLMDFSSCIR